MAMRGDDHTLDAYGEQTPPMRFGAIRPGERRARLVAMAVFWSLAAVLIAGRVRYAPVLASHSIELASR